MNNILGIKKLDLSGFTSYEPLIKFVQENNEWNNTNYCLSVENGYTNLNGITINGNINTNTIAMNAQNKNMGFSTFGNANFIFYNQNIERIRFANNGNIGVGISNPSYNIHVNGSINSLSIFKNNIELDNIYLNISNNQWLRNTSNIYTDTSLNISNVGIGNTNPSGNLHIGSPFINNSDGTLIISKRNLNTSNRNFKIGYDNNFNFCLGDFGKDNEKIWTHQLYINSNASANSLVVNSNSFIGIGISNPLHRLDVNGTINAHSFIGNGSNITAINYNNITSNRPELSNLNNWIRSSTTVYNNINNIAIGTTDPLSYRLNVDGSTNTTSLFMNNINISNIFLTSSSANNNYLKINDAISLYNSWTKVPNGSIYLTNYANNNNTVIIGDTIPISGITAKLYVFNGLYADNIIAGNGANIKNIDYNNINNKPDIYTVNQLNNLYYDKNYLNNIYSQFIVNISSNSFSTKLDYTLLNNRITTFIEEGLDPATLSEAISALVNNQDISIQYEKISLNPLILTRSTTNTPNIINFNGNFVTTNSYATDFFENNINIKNIYVSYATFNEVAKYYDTIVDRKRAIMSSCNIYPPQITPFTDYSNIITTSPYGNGLYVTNSSIFNSNINDNNSVHRIFNINKSNLNNIWTTANNFNNYSGNIDSGYTYRNTNSTASDVGRVIIATKVLDNDIFGHWIQLYYKNGFIANSFNITTYYTSNIVNDNENNINYNSMYFKLPRSFYLLATNDLNSNNWDILNYTTNLTDNPASNIFYKKTLNNITYDTNKLANSISVSINLPNVNNYYYYRFIFTQTINASEIAIYEINLYGAENKIEWGNSSSNIYYLTGNVGIGTVDDTSIYKLNINGSSFINSNLIINSNIGIGNTLPIANLHIGDSTIPNSDGAIVVSKTNINNNHFKFGYDNNFNFSFGDLKKNNDNSYLWKKQFYIHSNATENSLIIDTNGNIGINTNITNNYKLNIHGNFYIHSNIIVNSNIGIGTNNTEGRRLFVNGNSTFTGTINQTTFSDINLIGNIYATCNINVSNINTTNLNASSSIVINGIITARSNVGIGITTLFNETLRIESTSNIIGIWNGSLNMNNNSFINSFIGKDNTNGFFNKYTHINNNSVNNYLTWEISSISSILSLTANGYVGIGITNPANIFQIGDGGKLRISNNFNDFTLIGTKDGIDNNNTRIVINGSNKTGNIGDIEYRSTNSGNHLFYSNGNSEIIRFMSSGNVSIGTTNPNNYRLNINGSSYINSNLIINSNIGIGNTLPIANLHIGDSTIPNSDGVIVVSKTNINNNHFKFGYDNNFNFSFGDFKKEINNSYIWKKQFYIHSNATENSLIIDTNGNIGINTSITNNYKVNIIGDTYISGKIGIGTVNSENKKVYINGSTHILGQTDIQGSIFQASGNIVLGDTNSFIGIGATYDTNFKLKVSGNTNIVGNLIQTIGNVVIAEGSGYYVGIGGTFDSSYKLKISGNSYITGNLITDGFGNFNNYLCIATNLNPNNYKLVVNGATNVIGDIIQSGAGAITFAGKTTINSNLVVSATNRLYAIGNVGVGYADNAALNSNFNVLGTADFSSNMNVGGSLTQTGTSNNFIFGKTTFNSNLVVSATNRLYAIGRAGIGYADNAVLNSNFNVLGTADFSSNMNVGGELFCSNNIRENSRYLRDIYLNSNLLNNIKKKYGFLCVLSGLTTNPPYTENINGITYYKYDIDLTKYTQLKYLSDTSPYRIFNIKTFMTSGYFNLFNSNIPNILQYDIYMCNEISANPNLPGSSAGINICAIGTPENYRLTNILPTYFTILQNNSFNKLSIISTIPSLNVSCIIEDYLF